MNIPKGMTEQEVLEAIDRVANGLGHKFRFGYHGLEDMKQEARMEALKALDSYDASRGKLETFLWTHVKNRLSNLKRNKFERYDKPCLNCPLKAYDPQCLESSNQCTEYDDKDDCKPYYNWSKRNFSKKNIMSPVGMQNVKDEHESRMKEDNDIVESIYSAQVIALLDVKIPVALRSSWVKLKNDIKINKPERDKLLLSIRQILVEENYDS